MFDSLFQAFSRQVDSRPDAIALWVESPGGQLDSLSWRQLASVVAVTAAELHRRLGSNPSVPARIGHASDNSPVDVVVALASMAVGVVEVPIDQRLPQQEIERRWERVDGYWLDDRFRALVAASLASADEITSRLSDICGRPACPDSPSLILWTSGTTGPPRGVTLSHRNLVGNAAAKLAAVPQNTNDRRLCVLPLSHGYARTCDFGTWLLSGCSLAVTLGYEGLRRMAPRVRPTLINTVPKLAYRMLEENDSKGLDRLRLLGCSGAPMAATAFEQWKRRGVTVIQGYGLTETSPVICSATPENATPGLVGTLVKGWQSEIRDGQLYVRGLHVMIGYWDDESATREKIDGDGWLATGDLVQREKSNGQLRILGRVDDVIVLEDGREIHPAAVERDVEHLDGVRHAFLHQHQAVLQLWFDTHCDGNDKALLADIDQLLDAANLHACTVHRFVPRLANSSGELTAKGTIRRSRIVETRFGDQAGS